MKRDQVLDRTRHWFDAGHYQSLLSRRVAMPTASDQPGNQDVLRAYLSQEMVPDLMAEIGRASCRERVYGTV